MKYKTTGYSFIVYYKWLTGDLDSLIKRKKVRKNGTIMFNISRSIKPIRV